MKETARLVGVLTVIALGAGLLLAWVNELTAEPIENARRAVKAEAMKKVLPDHDNDPLAARVQVKEGDAIWVFHVAALKGRYVGAAFETVSPLGYAGDIKLMVGISADGVVQGMEVLEHKETPGLGAKIDEDGFKKQFHGMHIEKTRWAVQRDGGDVHEVTAATISSRAVVDAVKKGIAVYLRHKDAIRGQAPGDRGQ
jgi:electron transport complex protein RnfG